jgi:hypothetical protein
MQLSKQFTYISNLAYIDLFFGKKMKILVQLCPPEFSSVGNSQS